MIQELRNCKFYARPQLGKLAINGLPTIRDIEARLNRGTLHPFVQLIRSDRSVVFDRPAGGSKHAKEGSPLPGEIISNAIMRGFSLLMWNYSLYDPCAFSVANRLAHEFGQQAHGNIYLSPPFAQGLPSHKDSHDVLVVQLEGMKVWRVSGFADGKSFRLKKGDFLYMPRGCAHEAWSESEPSLHVTFGFGYGSTFNQARPMRGSGILNGISSEDTLTTEELTAAMHELTLMSCSFSPRAVDDEVRSYLCSRQRIAELLRTSPLSVSEVRTAPDNQAKELNPFVTRVNYRGKEYAVFLFGDLVRLLKSQSFRVDFLQVQKRLPAFARFSMELERKLGKHVSVALSWIPRRDSDFGASSTFVKPVERMSIVLASVNNLFTEGTPIPGIIAVTFDFDGKEGMSDLGRCLTSCNLVDRLKYASVRRDDWLTWVSKPSMRLISIGADRLVELSLDNGLHRRFPLTLKKLAEELIGQTRFRIHLSRSNGPHRSAFVRYLIREGLVRCVVS